LAAFVVKPVTRKAVVCQDRSNILLEIDCRLLVGQQAPSHASHQCEGFDELENDRPHGNMGKGSGTL